MIGKLVFGLIKQQVINILFSLLLNGVIIIKGIFYKEERLIKAKAYLKDKPVIKDAIEHLLNPKSYLRDGPMVKDALEHLIPIKS